MKYKKILLAGILIFAATFTAFLFTNVKNSVHQTPAPPAEKTNVAESKNEPDISDKTTPYTTTTASEEGDNNMTTSDSPNNAFSSETEGITSVSENDTTDVASEQTPPHPERITYMEGFYYEPITEELKTRINGLSYKDDCTVPYEDLRYVSVLYVDFNQETQVGEIVCNKAIADDLTEIFYELYENKYEIDKIKLVDEYNADDDLSCADNNTSCFNFRTVSGSTNLSKHALGLAIDINPFYNPYVTYPNGVERISPPGSEPYADRKSDFPHKIDENDLCYKLFTEHGFTWGGHWNSLKDYQHFQKAID